MTSTTTQSNTYPFFLSEIFTRLLDSTDNTSKIIGGKVKEQQFTWPFDEVFHY